MRDTRPDGSDGGAPGASAEGGAWRALAASVEAWLPVQVRTGGHGRPTDHGAPKSR